MSTAQMPARPAVPFSVRSVEELLEVVPSLLGFHPAESLVLVLTRAGRLVVTARVDIAQASTRADLQACLAPLAERFADAEAYGIVYSRDADVAWTILRLLEAGPVWTPLVLTAHVDGDRWFPTPDGEACPYDAARSPVVAEAAFRGLRVWPGRESLESALEPRWPEAAMAEALAAVMALAPVEAIARGLDVWIEVMSRPRALSAAEAAFLAVTTHCPAALDLIAAEMDLERADRARMVWTDVVRSTEPRLGGCAAVLLGLASWIGGDGAALNVALHRAQPYASETFWFGFLTHAAATALPPQHWADIRSTLAAASALVDGSATGVPGDG